MKRIGLLWIKSDAQTNRYLDDLRAALRALGYADGRDISLDDRFLVDRYSLIADAAARLVAEKVDVIVCFGGTAASALSKATRTIPIVMIIGADPVALGFANNLAKPGQNMTGITSITQEMSVKRIQVLKQALPTLRNVGVLFNPESKTETMQLGTLDLGARSLKMEIRRI